MFIAEGALTVRKDPSKYIGKYGLKYEVGGYRFKATGSRRVVNTIANRLHKKGKLPEYIVPEEITNAEQAKSFAFESKKKITIARFRDFDFLEKASKKIDEGEELVGGNLRLWRETRIPTPYVYCFGAGRLLADIEYDPNYGWQQHTDMVGASRKQIGLITPVLLIAQTNTEW